MNSNPPPHQQRFLQLDEVCDQFEQAWQANQIPSLAETLSQVAEDHQQTLVKDLLLIELRYRLVRGAQLKMSHYLQQLPEHTDAIQEVFLRLQNVEDAQAKEEKTLLPNTTRTKKSRNREALPMQPAAAESQALVSLEEIGTEFGDYELLDEIGRGGMGVVYRARQKSLDREVAVKMILAGSLADEESIDRFYAEAQAVGQLRHPNIVQIYEVGQHKGYHFFSMDYIEGQSLSEVMRSRSLTAKECAAYVKTIAEAVHNAHEAGIIHRDLKPANILTDATAQPLITDFGLAKRIKDDSVMTGTGKIMGTPSYMPPEQISSGNEPISPASDTYALGAILYELLTGRPPFRGESSMDTMLQVLEQEPVAPRVLAPQLDIDLETIALKCLEKIPSQRYESAQALADELGRYLKGQPITARPVTWMERSWRWCKRRPLAATVGSVLLLLLLVLSIGGPLTAWKQRVLLFDAANKSQTARSLQRESDQRRDEAIAARNDAEQQHAKVEETFAAKSRQLYIADMRLAGRYWASGDTGNVLTILERHRTDVEQDTSHRFEWHYLDRLCHSSMKTLTGQKYSIYCMAISPDGSRLAAGGRGGVDIWDPTSGKKLINIDKVPTIFSLAFSPDGKFLAAGGRDFENHETLNIWDWENEKITQTFTDYHRGSDVCFAKVSYSPDGRLITYPGQDGNIKVCQATTGKTVSSLQGHQKSAERPSFSPDGRRIVASSYHSADDQNVKVWDWASGQEVLTLGVEGHVTDVAFGPQGKWLAVTANQAGNKTIRIWEWKDDDKAVFSQVLSGLKRRILSLAFSPDGHSLVASGLDKRIVVWNVEQATPQRVFVGHTNNVYGVVFHPDGERVLSCSADNSIKIWDRNQRQGNVPLEGKRHGGHGVAFNPDGTQIAMSTTRYGIGVWDRTTKKKIADLSGHLGHVLALRFSPTGEQLVSASNDKTVRLWDLRSGETLFTFEEHKDVIHDVAFSPDGNLIASASADGTARVWDATNGRQRAVFSEHTGMVNGLAFSPDGKIIVSVGYDTQVRLWDPKSGVEIATLEPAGGYLFQKVAFRPDGRQIVMGDFHGRMIVWDTTTRKILFKLQAHEMKLTGLSFTGDGRRLATSSWDYSVKIWDTATWQNLMILNDHIELVNTVRFSPDGKWLASNGLLIHCLRDGRASLTPSSSHHGRQQQ